MPFNYKAVGCGGMMPVSIGPWLEEKPRAWVSSGLSPATTSCESFAFLLLWDSISPSLHGKGVWKVSSALEAPKIKLPSAVCVHKATEF